MWNVEDNTRIKGGDLERETEKNPEGKGKMKTKGQIYSTGLYSTLPSLHVGRPRVWECETKLEYYYGNLRGKRGTGVLGYKDAKVNMGIHSTVGHCERHTGQLDSTVTE